MALVEQSLAVQAAEENTALRIRMKRLEDDEHRNHVNDKPGETLDTTSADRLRAKNNSLRDEIAELQQELSELRNVNVTELYHQYRRLDNKRAYLNNENASLRNVLANQRKDVRRATNNVKAYQEARRQNEEQNTSAKDDVKMFKERREALQEETHKLNRKEARLQNELASMPAPGEDMEAERRKLTDDNAKKGARIAELERLVDALTAEKGARQPHGEGDDGSGSNASSTDVADLRREYVDLKEQLNALKRS